MEYWVTWLIVAGIGLVVGLIVHGALKFAQRSSVLAVLLAGILGALAAAYFITPFVAVPETSVTTMRYIWAVAGAAVLSLITEMLFVGTRRGQVVTS